MTDRAYGYFWLDLFGGAIRLPLKFCTSYPGEDKLRASAPTKCGVDGRGMNKINVMANPGVNKISKPEDIEQIIPWGEWETYLNVGTVTAPVLEPLSKYKGLSEILEQDRLRSKERKLTFHGIYNDKLLRPYHFTGRHFQTYPHTAKVKDSPQHHQIYKILAMYLKKNNVFMLVTYFSKGEELGAIYQDNGILRIAGLHAECDLKPVKAMLNEPLTKGIQRVAYEKFDTLVKDDDDFKRVLSWRDFVMESLEAKGVFKKAPKEEKIVVESDNVGGVQALFASV